MAICSLNSFFHTHHRVKLLKIPCAVVVLVLNLSSGIA